MYLLNILLLIVTLVLTQSDNHHSHGHQKGKLPWCPPENFASIRKKTNRLVKTALITEIHGQLKQTGEFWGTFLPGTILARNIHYHVGVLGFDKIWINVIYNDTVHPTPPTVTELYPVDTSCVSAWHDTGVLEWRYAAYAGPRSRWPLRDDGEPSTEKDLYKTLRGINPIYGEIMQRKEADWVMVLDADEYLVPINWKLVRPDWCSPKYPSVLELGTEQMLITATTVNLEDYPRLLKTMGQQRNSSEACMLGYGVSTTHALPSCREISAVILPVRFWTKHYPNDGTNKQPRMPLLRAKIHSSYPLNNELNLTVLEEEHQYHQWKSFHQTRFTPFLQGTKTMHYGHHDAFKVIAPRDYHGRISFEIAHIQRYCDDECRGMLVRDELMQDLSTGYYKCMAALH